MSQWDHWDFTNPRQPDFKKIDTSEFKNHSHVGVVFNKKYRKLKELGTLTIFDAKPNRSVLVKDIETELLYVRKAIKKNTVQMKSEVGMRFMNQVKKLRRFDHPNIVKLRRTYQTEFELIILLDYVNGLELYEKKEESVFFSLDKVRKYGAKIASLMGYFHRHNVVIGDVKPQKFLFSDDEEDLIFVGLPIVYELGDLACYPEYIAPEVLKEDINSMSKYFSKSSDWWSFGILLYEFFSGLPPFYCEGINTFPEIVIEKPLYFENNSIISWNDDLKNLISKLLEKDPKNRLDRFEDVQKHQFFKDVDWYELENRKKEIDDSFRNEEMERFRYTIVSKPSIFVDNEENYRNNEKKVKFVNIVFHNNSFSGIITFKVPKTFLE